MKRTLTNTHRLGNQPGRARVDGAIGQAPQGRCDHRGDDLGPCTGAHRSTTRIYVARQANITGASPAVSAIDGFLAAPTMWTKCSARPLATRST
jgi:hypothetical protein